MSTNAASISFSGLGSGIDTASIVQALMKLERMPIDRIESDKTRLKQKQGVVQEINGLLGKLRDASAAMYAPGALQGKTASSGDATVATASVGSQAASGTYNVVVTALAQAHTTASTAAPALTAGQALDITVGGETASVAIEAGDTLQKFADRINGTTDIGVSASVINDKLVLISKESGAGGTIGLGGAAAAGFGFATTQTGQDAAATVNGLAVTSAGNNIEGAINGVSLSLGKVGSTTVTVGADQAGSVKTAQAFVDAYNALTSNIKRATMYDAATKTAGTLQGDQTMSSLAGQLRGISGSSVTGLGGAYDSLSQIGFSVARDGTMTLDQNAFTAALAADPTAVGKLFGGDDGNGTIGASDGVARQIQNFAASFSTDILASRLTGYTASLGRLDEKISSLEVLMELKETRLRAQFQAMDQAVSRFQSQGADLASRLSSL
ncbi:flagellar filament capping protein FliD [Miltoncostaea oceani]|jgi:flagellar hook-associated protein 2|uniref:flagellar filament capping protein FliD n=1 Tax=Miltoncostaea oceani TaxID=2843216 RepID=UPI001C3C4393|nr:flagellar filament capping protein FliD [Miltoncostaea oceani]